MRYTERMSPILTMRAIRDTHKFSSHPKGVATQRTPFFVTERISELQVGDEGTPLQMERILNVMWGIHSTIREEVRGLLSETLNLPARDISHCRAQSCFEDGWNTQPSCIERPEWPFVPLFPRNRRLGCQIIDGAQTGKLDYFAELQKNILPQIPTEQLELDLFSGDMYVIDNWGECMHCRNSSQYDVCGRRMPNFLAINVSNPYVKSRRSQD
ncbi:hypothetical protein M378DRAFT_202672 [Amanita muscaria Koide BX008]|uniref:Uncharacterized protein n=1 Tax=Amanita muscaria (strain Koide BX008) TaxID=946122 RepID=A0A0C2TUZ9_AMAMK|nr:hypothetical protein M378DRAFT_202672 [Amanita muscaria Koide BX008]